MPQSSNNDSGPMDSTVTNSGESSGISNGFQDRPLPSDLKDTVIDLVGEGDGVPTITKKSEYKGAGNESNPTETFNADEDEAQTYGKTNLKTKDGRDAKDENKISSRPRELNIEKAGEPKVKVAPTESKPTDTKVEEETAEDDNSIKADDLKKGNALEKLLAKPKSEHAEQADEKVSGKRDYSIFPEEWKETLTKTSNAAFNTIRTLHLENQKLNSERVELDTAGVPKQWYNHPQAYQLHPTFQQINSSLQSVNFERNHMVQALDKIENGEDFTIVTGYDNKTNAPIYSSPIKPSNEAKVNILNKLSTAAAMQQQLGGQLNAFASNFQNGYAQEEGFVNEMITKNWPKIVNGEDKVGLKACEDFMSVVPSSFKNHPMTRACAVLWATLVEKREQQSQEVKSNGGNGSSKVQKAKTEPAFAIDNGNSGNTGNRQLTEEERSKLRIPRGRYTPPAQFSLD